MKDLQAMDRAHRIGQTKVRARFKPTDGSARGRERAADGRAAFFPCYRLVLHGAWLSASLCPSPSQHPRQTVNVYRLITKHTLEQKIMGLQRFKLNISKAVISSDNASLSSMGTDKLLDLFQVRAPLRRSAVGPAAWCCFSSFSLFFLPHTLPSVLLRAGWRRSGGEIKRSRGSQRGPRPPRHA